MVFGDFWDYFRTFKGVPRCSKLFCRIRRHSVSFGIILLRIFLRPETFCRTWSVSSFGNVSAFCGVLSLMVVCGVWSSLKTFKNVSWHLAGFRSILLRFMKFNNISWCFLMFDEILRCFRYFKSLTFYYIVLFTKIRRIQLRSVLFDSVRRRSLTFHKNDADW